MLALPALQQVTVICQTKYQRCNTTVKIHDRVLIVNSNKYEEEGLQFFHLVLFVYLLA